MKRKIEPITDEGAIELAAAIIAAIREDYAKNIEVVINNYPFKNYIGTHQWRDYWINARELSTSYGVFDSEYYDILTLGNGHLGKGVRRKVEEEFGFDEFKREHPDWSHELDTLELVEFLAANKTLPIKVQIRIAKDIKNEIKRLKVYIGELEAKNRRQKRLIIRLSKKEKTPSVGEMLKKAERENE